MSRRIAAVVLNGLMVLFAPRAEAQDLHRMLERLEEARGRIADGESAGAEVSSVRASFAARVARL